MIRKDNGPICLLGGCGFVGRHLAARLVAEGYRVRIISRNPARHRNMLVLPTVQLVQGNVHDPAVLTRELSGCSAVINLIGILNERGRDGSGFRDAHVELVRKIVQACRDNGVRRFLHVSALKADPANGPSHYLRSKGEGEAVIRVEAPPEMRTTIFQPSVIFGPDDSFINRFAALLRVPSPFFLLPRPNTRFAPVYVGDVAAAIVGSLNNPATFGKSYELCGPKVYSLREIVSFISDTLGVNRHIVGLNDGASRVLARLLEFVPGKPMSVDSYLSLKVHSICDRNGFDKLGIRPRACEAIAARFLTRNDRNTQLQRFRRAAGRRRTSA